MLYIRMQQHHYDSLLVEAEEVLLSLGPIDVPSGIDGINALAFGCGSKLRLPYWMAVNVLDQDGLREGRAVMDAGTSVAVTAGTDLVCVIDRGVGGDM